MIAILNQICFCFGGHLLIAQNKDMQKGFKRSDIVPLISVLQMLQF